MPHMQAAMSMSIDEIQGFMNESHVNSVPFLGGWVAACCGLLLLHAYCAAPQLLPPARKPDRMAAWHALPNVGKP